MPYLEAFIDESGDDGMGDHCPPWLVLSAIIFRQQDIPAIKSAMESGLAKIWGKNKKIPENVHFRKQDHDRRKALLQLLRSFNHATITCAINKRYLTLEQKHRLTCPRLYHFVAKHLVERLTWYAKDSNQKIILHFGSRKQIHFVGLRTYLLNTLRTRDTQSHDIKYPYIHGLGELAAKNNRLIQSADWTASAVAYGLNPNQYGDVEGGYVELLWGTFWIRKGNLWSYGLKCLPTLCNLENETLLLRRVRTWLEDPTTLNR